MSYVCSLFHIVIVTKNRSNTINTKYNDTLFRYIWGVVKKCNCKLLRINGIENHIHLLIDMPASGCLSDVVREIKRSSSIFAQDSPLFPKFNGWSNEYAAFSCSYQNKDSIIKYIINQQEHHKTQSVENEYVALVEAHGLTIYEKNQGDDV